MTGRAPNRPGVSRTRRRVPVSPLARRELASAICHPRLAGPRARAGSGHARGGRPPLPGLVSAVAVHARLPESALGCSALQHGLPRVSGKSFGRMPALWRNPSASVHPSIRRPRLPLFAAIANAVSPSSSGWLRKGGEARPDLVVRCGSARWIWPPAAVLPNVGGPRRAARARRSVRELLLGVGRGGCGRRDPRRRLGVSAARGRGLARRLPKLQAPRRPPSV
jgi:hypothetical protein